MLSRIRGVASNHNSSKEKPPAKDASRLATTAPTTKQGTKIPKGKQVARAPPPSGAPSVAKEGATGTNSGVVKKKKKPVDPDGRPTPSSSAPAGSAKPKKKKPVPSSASEPNNPQKQPPNGEVRKKKKPTPSTGGTSGPPPTSKTRPSLAVKGKSQSTRSLRQNGDKRSTLEAKGRGMSTRSLQPQGVDAMKEKKARPGMSSSRQRSTRSMLEPSTKSRSKPSDSGPPVTRTEASGMRSRRPSLSSGGGSGKQLSSRSLLSAGSGKQLSSRSLKNSGHTNHQFSTPLGLTGADPASTVPNAMTEHVEETSDSMNAKVPSRTTSGDLQAVSLQNQDEANAAPGLGNDNNTNNDDENNNVTIDWGESELDKKPSERRHQPRERRRGGADDMSVSSRRSMASMGRRGLARESARGRSRSRARAEGQTRPRSSSRRRRSMSRTRSSVDDEGAGSSRPKRSGPPVTRKTKAMSKGLKRAGKVADYDLAPSKYEDEKPKRTQDEALPTRRPSLSTAPTVTPVLGLAAPPPPDRSAVNDVGASNANRPEDPRDARVNNFLKKADSARVLTAKASVQASESVNKGLGLPGIGNLPGVGNIGGKLFKRNQREENQNGPPQPPETKESAADLAASALKGLYN